MANEPQYLDHAGMEHLLRRINESQFYNTALASSEATNYIEWVPGEGLLVGDKREGEWNGTRTRMDNDSFDILNQNGEVLASYGQEAVIKTKYEQPGYSVSTSQLTLNQNGLELVHDYSSTDNEYTNVVQLGEIVYSHGEGTARLVPGIRINDVGFFAEGPGSIKFFTENGTLELPTAITNQRIDEICV